MVDFAKALRDSQDPVRAAFTRLARGRELEPRESQQRMAQEVSATIANGEVLAVQAPCGTGKSFAYGIPAVLAAAKGARIVIATANKTLQDQLFNKDLPLLRDALAPNVRVRRLKGISNYMCNLKARRATELTADIARWTQQTETGELTELAAELTWQERAAITTSSDDCPGMARCPVESCWVYQARGKAKSAEIVVTNHHLFFADYASGNQLLGPYNVAILDEAHEAADIAREILGWTLSHGVIKRFVKMARAIGFGDSSLGALMETSKDFFDGALRWMPDKTSEVILHGNEKWPGTDQLAGELRSVQRRAMAVAGESEDHPARFVSDKAMQLTMRLASLSMGQDVLYLENTGGSYARFQFRPFSLEHVLRKLWEKTVVLTSATLAPGGDFGYLDGELGVPKSASRVVLDSPFRLAEQALVVVPTHKEIPDPNDDGFEDAAAASIARVIAATGGGVLALFTSTKRMERVAEMVRDPERFFGTIMVQGEAPKDQLLKKFIAEPDSVLFGVASFWTGVDVPGDALRAVIIDRLPFPRPDEPINLAMRKRHGRMAFRTYVLPRAALRLMQGAGRLVRRADDKGVIVILDRRVFEYGGVLLKALEPLHAVRGLSNVERWFR